MERKVKQIKNYKLTFICKKNIKDFSEGKFSRENILKLLNIS